MGATTKRGRYGYGYLYKQANDIIRKDLSFLTIIADRAKEHKFTIMMGRTHSVR